MKGLSDVTAPAPVAAKPNVLAKSKQSDEKAELGMVITAICQTTGNALSHEYRFHDKRRFKFDWAIVHLKIAVEYEGLMSVKSGHTTLAGYTENCNKYNLALMDGWRVLRYTAKNYKNAGTDLLALINKNK